MSTNRIDNAIRCCLDRCYESDNSTASVAAFMEELRDSGEWTSDELQAVYFTVTKLLRAVTIERRRVGGSLAGRP